MKRQTRIKLRDKLWALQGGRCCYCRQKMGKRNHRSRRGRSETFEHLKRRADGGRFIRSNIVLACYSCNQGRREMNWLEYATIKQNGWI